MDGRETGTVGPNVRRVVRVGFIDRRAQANLYKLLRADTPRSMGRRGGADPRQAVAARLAGRVPDPVDAALGTFIRSLGRNLPALQAVLDRAPALRWYDTFVLEQVHELIGQLLRQGRTASMPKAGKRKQRGDRD
jgi:hypothetical protein